MDQSINKIEDSLQGFNKLLFNQYYSLSIEAAYKGDYSLARTYISDLVKTNGEIPILLDLLAKINIQQGKFKEAEFLWEKCLKIEPENPNYITALHRLRKLQSSNVNRYSFVFQLSKFVLIILFFSFIVFLIVQGKKERGNELTLIVKNQDLITNRIDSILNLKETTNGEIFDLSKKIKSIDGITVHENDMKLKLMPNEGLFSGGINIKSTQIETLHELSKVLSPFAGKITVEIIGSTDNIPITNNEQFSSNDELSLSRAKVVYDIINVESKIPKEDLLIGSLSTLNSFFPNDSPENRFKNRTVIINIIQK